MRTRALYPGNPFAALLIHIRARARKILLYTALVNGQLACLYPPPLLAAPLVLTHTHYTRSLSLSLSHARTQGRALYANLQRAKSFGIDARAGA